MLILFFIIWVIFNGKMTLEIALFGIIISLILFWFSNKFLDYSIKKELRLYKSIFKVLGYVFNLLVEIIKANLQTMKFILSESEEVEPVIVEFDSDLKTSTARALLADSITLTPGTITVTMEQNHYMVHCLDESMSEDIGDSSFVRRLDEIEKIWTKSSDGEIEK